MRTYGNSGRRQTPSGSSSGATYVTDLTHLLDENGLPPAEAAGGRMVGGEVRWRDVSSLSYRPE